ncbi:MAG: hypothetical protein KDC38_18700, partial [Planctomycetes bacterium]|nr:hypothetical protein [Planctomycetota bacterium]
WVILNGRGDPSAVEATIRSGTFPVLCIWGDEGEGFTARREFGETLGKVDAERVRIVPIAQVEETFRYIAALPASSPKDEFGLAFGYKRALDRWVSRWWP